MFFLGDSVSSFLLFDYVRARLDLLEHGPHLMMGDAVHHSSKVVACRLFVQGRLPSVECLFIPPLLLE